MSREALLRIAVFGGVQLLLAVAVPPAGGAEGEPTYVGSEVCQTCHEKQWKSFQTSPHYSAELDGQLVADHVGCEACHGPGSLHVAAGGEASAPGFATIRNPKKLEAEEVVGVCRTCHRTGDQFFWDQSAHARQDMSCVSCHTVHSADSDLKTTTLLSAANATDVCLRCHVERQADLARTAHMPLREGGMTCVDCHNPHGSTGPRMIRATTVVDLCTSCHADKRGPFLWEHPPVREDCTTCHQAHGSNDAKLLAAKRPFLCQRCHAFTRHPSSLYDLPDLTTNRLFNRSCTNCHTQIHGSNHPSGNRFLR